MKVVDAELIKEDGSYLISDNSITGTSLEVLSFVVSGIKKSNTFSTSDGRPGRIDFGAESEYRTVNLTVKATAYDHHDVSHLRDNINALFDGEYYIREMRVLDTSIEYESPGERTGELKFDNAQYVNGKQLYVSHVGDVEPNDSRNVFEFDVQLETVALPYFETIYTTLELHDSGYSATAEKYGLVDNIDDEKVQYRFTENEFTVYNAGNVTVEPESMMLNIFASYVQSDGDFTIRNKTTSEEIILQRNSNGSHFRIYGMTVSLGSITNIFRDTNRRFISLAPGDNEIEISNGTFEEIRFDFKYLYK